MPAKDYPSILRHLSERRAAQFRDIVETLEAAQAAGAIANARYNDAKLPFSRAIEDAWDKAVQRPYLWNRDYPAGDAERDAMGAFSGSPAPHLMGSFTKKAIALGDTPAGVAVRDFLEEISPLMELMAHCKTITVKRQPKAEEPRPSEVYSAPTASGTAMGQVNDALNAVTKEARDHLASLICAREERVLNRYLKAVSDNMQPEEGKRQLRDFSPYAFARQIGHGQASADLRKPLEALTQHRFDGDKKIVVYEARDDFRDILQERSVKQADELCAAFIDRNLAKLASIVGAKGNFSGIEVIGHAPNPAGMDARLRVNFDDGSHFEARTSVVWSASPLGTPFTRFPVTFHYVVTPDGEMTRKMSQKQMNEDFIAASRPDQEASPSP
ncbi:hypothetical protein [Leisingera caerulea]|uniref:hypothetical protein n=1 Tax=Leisingera caerulea TaxID=506591 RepID=UPI0004227F6C|nr:hypothetical protein [Leisingera caerulea]